VTATTVPAQQPQASKNWPASESLRVPPLSIEDTLSPGIALPLIVIAGMPFTHDPYGFYGALAVMAVTSGVIMWWLKKNRWL